MKRLLLLLLFIAGGLFFANRALRPVQIPGIDSEPEQRLVWRSPIQRGLYTIIPLRSYALTARVLSKCEYPPGTDVEADLAPYDLALGWGLFADAKFSHTVAVSQGDRFYNWYVDPRPMNFSQIGLCSANNHIIPANDAVLRQVAALKADDVVQLTGSLVRVQTKEGWHWESSLTRSDTGEGACEVFYVEQVGSPSKPIASPTPSIAAGWQTTMRETFSGYATRATPSPRPATVQEAQAQALQKYPALGQAGSAFNTIFTRRYRLLQKQQPGYFQNPAWPLLLAEETNRSLLQSRAAKPR